MSVLAHRLACDDRQPVYGEVGIEAHGGFGWEVEIDR